jgi:hypothetical protein
MNLPYICISVLECMGVCSYMATTGARSHLGEDEELWKVDHMATLDITTYETGSIPLSNWLSQDMRNIRKATVTG